MTAVPADVLLFTSLKTYFGYAETRRWIHAIARIVAEARESGSFPMEVAIFPDVVALSGVAPLFDGSGISLGSQDVAPDESGPQTGEVSARVLVEIGCTFVEIGHAERRLRFGETDELIRQKLANAVGHGLIPVLCVGEQRGSGLPAAEFCEGQLLSALRGLDEPGLSTRLVIAYEPVRAIGAEESASPEQIVETVGALRRAAEAHPSVVDFQVIYGGSAGPATVPRLQSVIDGLFLGRFVHDPTELRRVIEAYAGGIVGG